VLAHAAGEAAGQVIEQLEGDDPDLVVCFVSPHFVGAFDDLAFALSNLLTPTVLIGATTIAVIGGAQEVEDGPAVSLFAAVLPDATLTPVQLDFEATERGGIVSGWPEEPAAAPRTTETSGQSTVLLLLADPFTFPTDAFLHQLDGAYPGIRVIGGAASAANGPGGNRLLVDDRVVASGAVGVLLDGVDVHTVVSQGCRPLGRPYVVTRAERNRVEELGGEPALERLQHAAVTATDDERELIRHGLHVGVVVDEHRVEFGRGDFLVRNVVGADPESGALAIGGEVAVGQTMQFHVRDAAAADEDLHELLAGHDARGALLFTCNGRGRRFFGVPDHDAGVVDRLLGPLPVAGALCAGEIGPVGGRNFVHGFTATLALFD
jgi:small ligand-binding sensory domain FIST